MESSQVSLWIRGSLNHEGGSSLQPERLNHFLLESGLGRGRHMVDSPHSVLAGLEMHILSLSPSYQYYIEESLLYEIYSQNLSHNDKT